MSKPSNYVPVFKSADRLKAKLQSPVKVGQEPSIITLYTSALQDLIAGQVPKRDSKCKSWLTGTNALRIGPRVRDSLRQFLGTTKVTALATLEQAAMADFEGALTEMATQMCGTLIGHRNPEKGPTTAELVEKLEHFASNRHKLEVSKLPSVRYTEVFTTIIRDGLREALMASDKKPSMRKAVKSVIKNVINPKFVQEALSSAYQCYQSYLGRTFPSASKRVELIHDLIEDFQNPGLPTRARQLLQQAEEHVTEKLQKIKEDARGSREESMTYVRSILLPAKRLQAKPYKSRGNCTPAFPSFDRKRFERLSGVRRLGDLQPLYTKEEQQAAVRKALGSRFEVHTPPNNIIALGKALLAETNQEVLQSDMLYYLAARSKLKATPQLAEKLASEKFDFTLEEMDLLLELTTYIGQGVFGVLSKRRFHAIVVIGKGTKLTSYVPASGAWTGRVVAMVWDGQRFGNVRERNPAPPGKRLPSHGYNGQQPQAKALKPSPLRNQLLKRRATHDSTVPPLGTFAAPRDPRRRSQPPTASTASGQQRTVQQRVAQARDPRQRPESAKRQSDKQSGYTQGGSKRPK
eukprot:m.61452 g.61452  ORF g.61452 m.61452 type:complete len:577 (-) comp13880_c0_seq1:112-1842(-)